MTGLGFHDVEVDGRRVDVLVEHGTVTALDDDLPFPDDAELIDGRGGALIPGLWDHHIHLMSLAASLASVRVGPPEVHSAEQLAAVLREAAAAAPNEWIRGVGYHESVAGDLDRWTLDRMLGDTPLRLQHRSGAMWILNSAALATLDLRDAPDGVDRDGGGLPTGRIVGADRWLGGQLESTRTTPPDLDAVGRLLAGHGVVGCTDATPYPDLDDLANLVDAVDGGALPQRLTVTGGPTIADRPFPAPVTRGPVKLLLADHSLPDLDQLVEWIGRAHDAGRPVATHCVTRVALVLTLTALDVAGVAPGDRIEHGSVVPPELVGRLRDDGLTVVTQPGFVAERGDRYRREVDEVDRPHLYPCGSLLAAGVAVAGSTDAPFGAPDPWIAIRAATDRRTADGHELGPDEAVDADAALGLFLGTPDDPGRTRRRVAVGASADLCLLRVPGQALHDHLTTDTVAMTIIGGEVAYDGR